MSALLRLRSRFLNSAMLLMHMALWSGISLLLLWAWHLKHPTMFLLRFAETPLLLCIGVGGAIYAGVCRWRTVWYSSRRYWTLVLCAMLLLIGLTAYGEMRFYYQKRQVLAGGAAMEALGQHFIVGFTDWKEAEVLAGLGLIGGVHISGRNIADLSRKEVRMKIARLQSVRHLAGLPPLLIAADQEGGLIQHLSPMLPRMAPLSDYALLAPADAVQAAYAHGQKQGRTLRELGITLNLAPVVDLKPNWPVPGDTHSRIAQRAISKDQETVTRIAGAYSTGLHSSGVQATLKHFPGLGGVRRDTHHTAAHLNGDARELARDWQPFREISNEVGVAIMLGHVTLDRIDPKHAVSHSHQVVQEVLRKDWGYNGLLLTDDLNMGAVYGRGIGKVSIEALNAGVDYLLVSYDLDQFYRALSAVAKADLDPAMLASSRIRMGISRLAGSPRGNRVIADIAAGPVDN